MSKPVLAMGLLAAMAGAWYWALLPAAPAPPRGAGPRPVALPASRDVPAVRLGDLAADAASRPRPSDGRNPFRGATTLVATPPASPVAPVASTVAPAGASSVPAMPAWPRIELIGLAEATHDGGLLRTAIVSGPHGVIHARPGDVLERVYRLERIGADGIDVRLLPEDRVVRLALPP